VSQERGGPIPGPVGIYLDENVSSRMVPLLSTRGIAVLHARSMLPEQTSDHLHLAFAARSRRVLLTHDEKDFRLLHHAWQDWGTEWGIEPRPVHHGILVIPQQPFLTVQQAVELVADLFLTAGPTPNALMNRFLSWSRDGGWHGND
jgi:Domain of unknown function (DUF5615)